ncbi:MAG: MFS transporter [Rhodospirillaceae bacterium]|nr:MFS transporter [Rhodospirillaceae bacterium]
MGHVMEKSRFLFLNIGHSIDHLFMLMFPAVAALAAADLSKEYGEVLRLATGSFIAFGVCSLPMGWLADRLSREFMMAVFFVGMGISMLLTGLAQEPWELACALTLMGVFAAIYHPVGLAMVSQGGGDVGRRLGVNGVWGNMGVAASALSIGVFADLAGWREAFFLVGVLSIILGFGWVYITKKSEHKGGFTAKKTISPSENWKRVLVVVAITATVGGFIFNSMTVSLPKVLDDTLSDFFMSSTEVGAIASIVYAAAAFTQIAVGRAIDKYSIKPIFLIFVAGQAIFLYLGVMATGWLMVGVAVVIMVLVFGQIPINDTLIARYTPDTWRGRVYSVKYVLTFTVSAAVVPSVAWLYEDSGGFELMFILTAIAAVIITITVLAMPGGKAPIQWADALGSDD